MKSLADYGFSGIAALQAIVARSEYKTLAQAVASLAVFSHPDTVKQTNCQNLFPIIRARGSYKRKEFSCIDGRDVMHDDNWSAKQTFVWANDVRMQSKKDVQYNHVVARSDDVRFYTNLTNIVALPAFLSKLTDTHKEIAGLLRFRSTQLYGPILCNESDDFPSISSQLTWSDPLPPVKYVEETMRRRMSSCKMDRAVICARKVGWYFSSFEPDTLV